MTAATPSISPHNEPAAAMWNLGGRFYDDISFALSDALAHTAQRLRPHPGEQVLDVATGTGWTARNAARMGAHVTAIDIAPDLVAAAESLSAHMRPPIDFRVADAERLPFEDASFDRVISTFGVMFAADQERAAAELARVCRPGGRLAVSVWVPDGSVAEFFAIIGRYSDAPPPDPSPLAWGAPERIQNLLGDAFELTLESGINHAYHEDNEDVWHWYSRGFGPIRQLIEGLDADRLEAFRRDFDDYNAPYFTEAGIHLQREYRVILGRRR